MANTKSALKNIRKSERRRQRNRVYRSRARTLIKKTRLLIEAGDLEKTKQRIEKLQAASDEAGGFIGMHL